MNEPQETADAALESLLSVAREIAPDLPEDLLRRVFALQRIHQFDAERDVSLQDLQRALEDYLGQPGGNGGAV